MPNGSGIRRVLIANRGEIARRIIRTCSRLGIETVAVYTDVDADAPHVREATEAHAIGEPYAYLNPTVLIDAAKGTGADSLHPGYGFLSENPDFAALVTEAGLTWIGPPSETIRKLGSKTVAKELAKQAQVPTSPTLLLSSIPTDTQAAEIEAFGRTVGFPLILKAAAGGGGRGMRILQQGMAIAPELESARRESLKAFKSDEVFVEKCVTPARHIEVQIAADAHGNVVALGSRDCSLQRNNQKILEEAPAPCVQPGVELKLFEAACALARAAGYRNLGTVEFLYTPVGEFYFLEVNTRLQVEHPITELVTGLDLVELQLQIAQGASLATLGVADSPAPRGHAIEARWCAEEYTDRFVTATGIVLDLEVPTRTCHNATVRVDTGVEPCSRVSHFYDSLIAKVIVHADSRAAAIEALDDVLSRSRLSGVKNNRALLTHLIRTNDFKEARHTVQGTADLLPTLHHYQASVEQAHALSAAIRCASAHSPWAENTPWLTCAGPDASLRYEWKTTTNDATTTSSTTWSGSVARVSIDKHPEREWAIPQRPVRLGMVTVASVVDDKGLSHPVTIHRDGVDLWVHTKDGSVVLRESTIGERELSHSVDGASEIRSTIPGKVASVVVREGDVVEHGSVLLVLDSMKMEHPIRATTKARVVSLPAPLGASIQSGTLLAVLEPV